MGESTNQRAHAGLRTLVVASALFGFSAPLVLGQEFAEPPSGNLQERATSAAVHQTVSDGDTSLPVAPSVEPVTYQVSDDPMAPIQRQDSLAVPSGGTPEKIQSQKLEQALLGGSNAIGQLSKERQYKARGPATDAVLGAESLFRKTTDTGNLVGKSITVRGVSTQQRGPIVTDTRVRGQRAGQVLAAGSFWTPVRMDLDTMMSKIDSRLIDNLLVIKGPYSPRYGPGFSFIDIDLLATPRYEGGMQHHGTTSIDYLTNGEQVYGRQTLFGGNDVWGYRVSYGHRTGNDYETGDPGRFMPSSYNSRDLNVALGFDPSRDQRIEFNYLRLDQTGVEYPGLVFDTRYLVTNGYELKYFNEDPRLADYHFAEVWFNRTRFEGDTFGLAKNLHIPSLKQFLYSDSGFDGTGVTDGDGSSLGYRNEFVYGNRGFDHLAIGSDMIYLKQGINDREDQLDPAFNNFPLLPSESMDFGFYFERVRQVGNFTTINAGARIDTIATTASADNVDGFSSYYFDDTIYDQTFTTWTAYLKSDTQLTEHWTGTVGLGLGQRPPTLTEMYTHGTFIGSLQKGVTFMTGDPELRPEILKQVDVGLSGNYERLQMGANYFHAWIEDYITYDSFSAYSGSQGLPSGAGYVNTARAIMQGVEAYGRYQWLPRVDLFGGLSYVEGDDRTRDSTFYFDSMYGYDRSGVSGVPVEPLPGIPPLDSRIGFFLHEPGTNPSWGVECSMRAVARQDRVATTLGEIATPGFTTIDIRGFKRVGEHLMLTGGVENLTDRFYREHLDYRSGWGVFRPGIGFYTGVELNY